MKEECKHEWEFRKIDDIDWEVLFCKKCNYLRGSINEPI